MEPLPHTAPPTPLRDVLYFTSIMRWIKNPRSGMQITKEDVEYPRAAPCGDDRCDLEFAAELTHTV